MDDLFARLGPPVQIAYAVPDAEAAAWHWSRRGVGPFILRRHIPVTGVTYRGRPATFDHTSAYGQWGPLMVELVQDHTAGPSAIADLVPPGTSRLHHLAFVVDDLAGALDELERSGMPLAMRATSGGGITFHFVDTVSQLGHMIELYEPSPHLDRFYAMVAEAARGWDGTDPVRG